MQLTTEVGAAAKEALTVMVQARIQVENAYRIVSDALDGGLRTQEMLMLTTQTRQRIQQGQSAKLCEQAAQDMVQERTRTQTELQTKTKTKTEAGQSSGTQAGSETPTGLGK